LALQAATAELMAMDSSLEDSSPNGAFCSKRSSASIARPSGRATSFCQLYSSFSVRIRLGQEETYLCQSRACPMRKVLVQASVRALRV